MNKAELLLELQKGSIDEQRMLNKGYSHVAVPSANIDYWTPPSQVSAVAEPLPQLRPDFSGLTFVEPSQEQLPKVNPQDLYNLIQEKNLYDSGRRKITAPSGKEMWLTRNPIDKNSIWKEETTGIPFYSSLQEQEAGKKNYDIQIQDLQQRLGK